jgi:glycosyltransferase involved in cell wall biosynthesis
MKVTIITVTYNSERFLRDCFDSVVNQAYPNIEHIVIDAASTDSTVSIINEYKDKIAQFVSEKDNGMYDAINKGMSMATGDVIGILNSDDMLASKDVIGAIAKCFEESKVDSLYGDLVYVDQVNTRKVIRYWKGFPYKRYRFTYGWMPAHPTFYFRKDLLKELGGYESHYFTAADYEFMARYLYRYRISAKYLPMLIVKMRVGGQSNRNIGSRLRANRRDYLAMKVNNIPFPHIASILKPLIKLRQYYYTLFKKMVD